MNIKKIRKEDLQQVADFISILNNEEESHIGYVGIDRNEIASYMKEEMTDIPFYESFVGAFENGEILGMLGFEADLEGKYAEIWGPFVKKDKWEITEELWNEMELLLPDNFELNMFPNQNNRYVLNFANNHGFSEDSNHTVLTCTRDNLRELANMEWQELSEEYFPIMKQLHDQEFPSAYYSGQKIIEQINSHQKVFIITNGERLSGYIYVEAEPEFGEGSIEFFAVSKTERGKGIGKKLLTVALQWLFSFDNIARIQLTVDSENERAINLYKKIGFQQEHDLCFLIK